ncbi:MAG: hypothetical protein KF774_03020 [Planctomyces sp.]|nr:hypothetical protein [Planctomyces sp.]
MARAAFRVLGLTLVAALVAHTPLTLAEDAPAAGKTWRLRYRFDAGQTVYFTVWNETVRRYQHSEVEARTRDGNDSLKHYRVMSVDAEGNAKLELTIDRTRMFAEKDSTLFQYDSQSDAQPPDGFEDVARTIGRPWLHVTLNDRGEPLDFQTPLGERVVQSPDLLSRVLPALPEQEVAIGDVWKEPFTTEVRETETLNKPIRMQRTYRLKSVEGSVATIEFSTQVLTANKTPEQDAILAQRIYSGTVTLDIDRGLMLARELKVDQSVIGYAGAQTALTIRLDHRDEIAPGGAKTPLPATRSSAAERTAASDALKSGN